MVYEKIWLEANINKEYIRLKNNAAELYLISGRAEIVPVYLGILQTFTDFQQYTWFLWKACEYQSNPQVHWQNSDVSQYNF